MSNNGYKMTTNNYYKIILLNNTCGIKSLIKAFLLCLIKPTTSEFD